MANSREQELPGVPGMSRRASATGEVWISGESIATSRPMKSCETVLHGGYVACRSLILEHLRWQTHIMAYPADRVRKLRATLVCLDCRGHHMEYSDSSSTQMVESWLRNMEVAHTGATSISWQLEVQPLGSESNGVFTVWRQPTIPDHILRRGAEQLFGKQILDTLTAQGSQGIAAKRSST